MQDADSRPLSVSAAGAPPHPPPAGLDDRIAELRTRLAGLDRAVVCFSGGVDSGYLLAEAAGVLGDRATALTAVSPSSDAGSITVPCACSTSKLMPLTACKLTKHLTKSRATMIDVLSMDDT